MYYPPPLISTSSLITHFVAGRKDIEPRKTNGDDPKYDPATKRRTPGDFDLPSIGGSSRKPSARDYAGTITLPFAALDLTDDDVFNGPRHYRHDAEAFLWSILYICIFMEKDKIGRISTANPHPLQSWLWDPDRGLARKGLLFLGLPDIGFPLHERALFLVPTLYHYWICRFNRRERAMVKRDRSEAPELLPDHEEPSDHESFQRIFQIICRSNIAIPESRRQDFCELIKLVCTRHPFLLGP